MPIHHGPPSEAQSNCSATRELYGHSGSGSIIVTAASYSPQGHKELDMTEAS